MAGETFRREVVFHEGIVTQNDIRNLIRQVTSTETQQEIAMMLQFTLVDGSEISESSVDVLNQTELQDSSRITNLNFEFRNADGLQQITGNLKPIRGMNFWPFSNKNTWMIKGFDKAWANETYVQLRGIQETAKQRQTGPALSEFLLYPFPFALSVLLLMALGSRITKLPESFLYVTLIDLSALSFGMLIWWFVGVSRFRKIYPKLEIMLEPAESVAKQRKARFRKNVALDLVVIALWLILTILNPLRFLL